MKKEHYRIALKYLKETVAKNQGTGTAFYSIFNEKSNRVSHNTSCHQGLHTDGAKKSIGVINCIMKGYWNNHGEGKWDSTTEEEKLMFLDWLTKRSPYKTAFVSKSPKAILKRGAAIMDSSVPGNLMGGACVSFRRMWEHVLVTQVWCDLVKAGVNENLAYILGHLASGTKDGGINWHNLQGWHVAISTRVWDTGYVKNFVEGKVTKITLPYNLSGDYNGYSEQLFDGDGGKELSFIHHEFPYKNEEEKVNTNPFQKAVVKNITTNDYQTAIAKMAEFQHHIMKVCDIKLEKANA